MAIYYEIELPKNLSNARGVKESFKNYRKRLKENAHVVKVKLEGRLVYDSANGPAFRLPSGGYISQNEVNHGE